jgi:hypothetical protein
MNEEDRALIKSRLELFELRKELERAILHFYKYDDDGNRYAAEELLKTWEEVNAELHKKITVWVK